MWKLQKRSQSKVIQIFHGGGWTVINRRKFLKEIPSCLASASSSSWNSSFFGRLLSPGLSQEAFLESFLTSAIQGRRKWGNKLSFQSGEANLLFAIWKQKCTFSVVPVLCRDICVTWGKWKHRSCVSKAFHSTYTGQERGCNTEDGELCQPLRFSSNLDSLLQHCGVLSQLLSDSTQLTLTRTCIIFWQFKPGFACSG